jgi:dipeptidyl aminopeptidase/acylaminoacyl peptidase
MLQSRNKLATYFIPPTPIWLLLAATACASQSAVRQQGEGAAGLSQLEMIFRRVDPSELEPKEYWGVDLAGNRQRLPKLPRHSTLSPDGRSVAYFDVDARHSVFVLIMDIASGSKRRLTVGPKIVDVSFLRWSPDGNWLVVSTGDRPGQYGLGVIAADNSSFRVLSCPSQEMCYSPAFGHDSSYLLCQDITHYYEIDRQGRVLRRQPYQDLLAALGNSAHAGPSDELAVSPEGGEILIGTFERVHEDRFYDEVRDEMVDGLRGVIVRYDRKTGASHRMTSKELYAGRPRWHRNGELWFFEADPYHGKENELPSIYRMKRSSSDPELVIQNGVDFSVR